MNILASYNWIKEYLKTELSPEEFSREMSLKSMAVESIERLSEKFDAMVIGLVKEIKKHPDADKLNIAITDIGGKEVEIVCGGKNLAEGMRVLVALPGSKVRWHGEGDLVELKEAKIRGVSSFGMICAPAEVGFEKAPCLEGGIWDLTDLVDAKPGTSFVDAFNMDDVIFDMEVTTNRSDSMNIVGLAREAGAALEQEFEWNPQPLTTSHQSLSLSVQVDEPDLCPRYMAVVVDGIKVGPSPLWMQQKLLLAGYKPINNIVDITNYILHEYGQPMHAFDYEKLNGGEIVVRRAKDGEKFLALDDIEYELTDKNLVIADAEKSVAVAGVMGGKDSGTWDGTTKIVFEAATFDSVSVRKTARQLNLYSQSQTMFEKGLSSEAPAAALARAVELTLEIAGGSVASAVQDMRAKEYEPLHFSFNPEKARALIGVDISDDQMINILKRLGFVLKKEGEVYDVIVPYWRDHDIEAEVDFTEEIARMYGYHNIPAILPDQAPPTIAGDEDLAWEIWIKRSLAAMGYAEFYGYSFVSENDLTRYDLDPSEAMAIHNPLSSDLTHMRTSLMPSVLKDIEFNQGQRSDGRVFELQRAYLPQDGDLPSERTNLVIAHFGVQDIELTFQKLKGILEYVAKNSDLKIEFIREMENVRWHPTRSASVKLNGQHVGMIGQVAQEYQEAFGIDRAVIAADLDIEDAIAQMNIKRVYKSIPEFPAVHRDIAVVVDEKTEYLQVSDAIKKQSPLIESIELVEVYRGTGIDDGKKSVTISITLRALDKTLSSDQVDEVMNVVGKVLQDGFDGILR
jgi:phenylalanyl-tRNA synthetase beta chain